MISVRKSRIFDEDQVKYVLTDIEISIIQSRVTLKRQSDELHFQISINRSEIKFSLQQIKSTAAESYETSITILCAEAERLTRRSVFNFIISLTIFQFHAIELSITAVMLQLNAVQAIQLSQDLSSTTLYQSSSHALSLRSDDLTKTII